MACSSSSKKKEKKSEFSPDTLSRSKHGIACVANIDVRGNVSIYAIFKRALQKNSKPVFDFATILGYVGGEFRDGFCQENLKEGESVRFLESYVSTLESKRIGKLASCGAFSTSTTQEVYQKRFRFSRH